jgi:hypothetical protein
VAISSKPTSGQRRWKSVLGHNFRIARDPLRIAVDSESGRVARGEGPAFSRASLRSVGKPRRLSHMSFSATNLSLCR